MIFADETKAPLHDLRASAQVWLDYARKWAAKATDGSLDGYVQDFQRTVNDMNPNALDVSDDAIASPETQAEYSSAYDEFSALVDKLQVDNLAAAAGNYEDATKRLQIADDDVINALKAELDAAQGGFFDNLFGGFGDIFKSFGVSAAVVVVLIFVGVVAYKRATK